MLLFTNAQQDSVRAARASFNETQVAMAARLGEHNGSIMVGNSAPVPLDAWRRIDMRGSLIQRDVLAVFNTLAAASQTPLQIADLVSYFPKISDSGDVHVSMDGRSEGPADQAIVKYEGTPVPILDSYARFGWRQMEVIRKGGGILDTETVANHQRRVAEKMEDMALNGLATIVVGGATIYGLRTFPNRTTATHGIDLNNAATTGANWATVFKQLIDAHQADNSFGDTTVFLNYSDYTFAANTEFVANYPKKILNHLLEMKGIAAIIPCSKVPADDVIGVNKLASGEWGSILSAMPLTTRPKARHNPEDDYTFGVMSACAPQFRSDFGDRSHIVQLTRV